MAIILDQVNSKVQSSVSASFIVHLQKHYRPPSRTDESAAMQSSDMIVLKRLMWLCYLQYSSQWPKGQVFSAARSQ